MTPAIDSDFEWHPDSDTPSERGKVAFDLVHDPVRRSGSFRNFLYIECGIQPRIWSASAVERWVYLDMDGKMMRKAEQSKQT